MANRRACENPREAREITSAASVCKGSTAAQYENLVTANTVIVGDQTATARGSSMIYYEDTQVGAVTEHGTYEVTREEMIEFASKYDPQPFHLSDEAAAETHFGRLSASGWHTCAMANGVIARNVTKRKSAAVGSPGVDELRWTKPVFAGDNLRVSGEILEKRLLESRPNLGMFKVRTTVKNQNDEVVLSFVGNILIKRRPSDFK